MLTKSDIAELYFHIGKLEGVAALIEEEYESLINISVDAIKKILAKTIKGDE